MLFVWPVCTFSVWDVARGYRHAFEKILGADNIRDYNLNTRTEYHRRSLAFDLGPAPPSAVIAKNASESVLAEALLFDADVVFIVSGLNFHPVGLYLCNKVGVHLAAVLTESPYDDENQADWSTCSGMIPRDHITIFTNELASAEHYDWHYLAHAYDPDVHYPREANFHDQCDVLMVGTGWMERQVMFESIDWGGIDIRLDGIWPAVTPDSPIHDLIWPVCVDNLKLPDLYSAAKICVNIHRSGMGAKSLNPRAYEIAACGAFQLSDYRDELPKVFGDSVPTFSGPEGLKRLVDYYLTNEHEREVLAARARHMATYCTFDARAGEVLDTIDRDLKRRKTLHLVGAAK